MHFVDRMRLDEKTVFLIFKILALHPKIQVAKITPPNKTGGNL